MTHEPIAQRIVEALKADGVRKVLEIGPGMGVLTKYLVQRPEFETHVVEIDHESVAYLNVHFPQLAGRILAEDFLHYPVESRMNEPFAIIGNFPYNISSQIFFRVIELRNQVPEVVGMLQKEVAERLTGKPGNKDYGILSVFLQAYYHTEYLFTVDETVFNPPPRVKSGVIRIWRNEVQELGCNESLFRAVVKTSFGQRRKTLRNSLKSFPKSKDLPAELLSRRPEELSVHEFIALTKALE